MIIIIITATLREQTGYTTAYSKKGAPTKRYVYSTIISMISTFTSYPFLAIVGNPSVIFIDLQSMRSAVTKKKYSCVDSMPALVAI